MTDNIYWNGLPMMISAVRGTAVVEDISWKFPAYWVRREDLVGKRIKVVMVNLDRVDYKDGIIYLDNRDGSGWTAVTIDQGSPRFPQRMINIVPGTFIKFNFGD